MASGVKYTNYCIPQEKPDGMADFYLESNAGRTFSGTCESRTLAKGALTRDVTVGTTEVGIVTSHTGSKDFVYIKNTGNVDITMCLNHGGGNNFLLKLSGGQVFASDIDTSARIYAKTASGITTIEYYMAT